MRTISNHNNSSYLEFLKTPEFQNTVVSRADSLAEVTKLLEIATPFLKAETQQIQELRDDERRGYLMQEIMRLHEQLGITSSNQRILKSMTTLQLDAYAEELNQQLKNRPFKHLSAA